MKAPFLKIRDINYALDKVLLRITVDTWGVDRFVTFSLFADSLALTRAGFAINSMTISGKEAFEIANITFELDENSDDELNDLRESVICEPGAVLEISHLSMVFGAIQDEFVDTLLEASCFRVEEESLAVVERDIRVTASFAAIVRIERE